MPHTFLRLLLVSSLVAACSRSDATTRDAAKPTAVANTAGGTIAGSLLADTISERADHGRILGDSTATVWLIMASDFQCPFCKDWHDKNFAGIMKDYIAKGRIRAAFVNYPLSQHQFAVPAAEAAMCASVQGKFWPMHESLFATQTKWVAAKNPAPMFDSLAAAAGVNMTAYKQCVAKHLTLPLIDADHDRAKNAGAQSTPTFFIGDQVLAGSDKDLRPALDAALAKAGGAKKPGN